MWLLRRIEMLPRSYVVGQILVLLSNSLAETSSSIIHFVLCPSSLNRVIWVLFKFSLDEERCGGVSSSNDNIKMSFRRFKYIEGVPVINTLCHT